MKKMLVGAVVVLALIGAAAFFYRDQITMTIAFQRIKPDHAFAAGTRPVEPDYSLPQNWAALPDREDFADLTPSAEVQNNQASAAV
jgi:hypothetical protein